MNTLKEKVSATSEHRRKACRGNYGKVRISAAPAQSFSFKSEAAWPRESYDSFVRRGILDALSSCGVGEEFGAEFTLEEVGWHEVDSCGDGYYRAARRAAEEILAGAGIVNGCSPAD